MFIGSVIMAALSVMTSSAHAADTATCVQYKGSQICGKVTAIQDSSQTHQRYEVTELTDYGTPIERPTLFAPSLTAKEICTALGAASYSYFTNFGPERFLGVFGNAVQTRTEHHQVNVMYENGDCRLETMTFHYYEKISCIARN